MEQEIITPRIGAAEVRAATEILKKYKQGKAHLEQRIIDNEQFWKLRHWEQMDKGGSGGKLFGAITGKEISEGLKEQFDLDIAKQKIVVAEPVKQFGTYEFKVRLGSEVSGTVTVIVSEEK